MPMTRVLAIYNPPADPAAFDAHYFGTHVPIARRIPGLRGMRFSKSSPMAIAGAAPYLVAELDFDSMAEFNAGFASPEGQATAGDLANFAQAGVNVVVYETREDR
jgi:uncharacterized protein (TIGR02118 family)